MTQPYILLADDDPDEHIFFSESMSLQKKIGLQSFCTAEKVIWYLAHLVNLSDMPSLVILDINMPRINGSNLLSIIKDCKRTAHIPIIMYSTTCTDDLKEVFLQKGALDCYTKPVTLNGYNKQVDKFIELAKSLATQLPEQSGVNFP